MTLVWTLLRGNTFKFLTAILLSALSAGCGVAVISMISRVSSADVITGQDVALLFVLIGLLFGLSFFSQAMLTSLGHHVVYRLRLHLSQRVLKTSVERIDQLGQPAILAALTKDVTSISQAFNSLPFVVYGAAVLLCCYGYLLQLSLPFFLCTLVMTILAVVIARQLMSSSRRLKREVRENDDALYDRYSGLLLGRNELKLSRQRRSSFFSGSLKPVVSKALGLEVKADRYTVLNGSWVNTSILLLIATIILIHSLFGVGTREQLTTFALTILYLRSPLAGMIGSLPALILGSVAYAKVQQLALHEGNDATGEQSEPQTQWQTLQMRDVTYQYPSESGEPGFGVGPVNFELNQGELVFWVGGNGSGKSTCARLVTGLYTPHTGQLIFAGQEIHDDNRDWFLSHFSVVFADFYLFKQLINESGEQPDAALVEHYLNALALEQKVTVTGGELSTTKLSQGQRKRLALLLAYLENRSIILLDEWAADQDPAFRKVFYTELLPELKARGKTVIAITHDDHYFHMADKIYRIHQGNMMLLEDEHAHDFSPQNRVKALHEKEEVRC
ncbi:cyclic peptide export ABC transporter [Vibrio mangrovi]|uniref:ABC transporter ATP-binding protein YojI n=1 Tax=Vibrio mangrovi TaxID=474394 RepID=A0A1Y6IQL7_9VIBR|nr:cyclic peptide export ABC transporter [Vibrio mangrovi]MDW6003274.1 cyclic peptide export ABC transporter [Vibrio mangrovi]SMR99937.1 ABC transporter ATP-binding protein YojI [Vibrio mangrovi]